MKEKKRGFNWFLLVIVGILVYFSSVLMSQHVYLTQVEHDQEKANRALEAAQQENERLKKEKDSLNDPVYIEKIAREELGMTKQGELPYRPGIKQ